MKINQLKRMRKPKKEQLAEPLDDENVSMYDMFMNLTISLVVALVIFRSGIGNKLITMLDGTMVEGKLTMKGYIVGIAIYFVVTGGILYVMRKD